MISRLILFFALLFSVTGEGIAQAEVVHWSADRTKVNRLTKIVELRGNAHLSRNDEDVQADEIDYDQTTQIVNARGRVQYRYSSYFVKADQIEVDLLHKTGVITNGNLTNGMFALRGSKIEQLSSDRMLVKNFDYTTCMDCPNAWEMTGQEVDLTVDGYAHIKDFVFKVKDAPMFWMPYMIVPVKTRRQSGLLFPRFGVSGIYGVYVVEPAFWAINDWSDMTLGTGYFSNRGVRFEWEGRYALTPRSQGQFNLYFTKDQEVHGLNYRYAGKFALTQELPFKFEAKFKVNEVSDSGYPITYADDIQGRYESVLASDLFFSRNDPNVSTVVALRRFRNLLFYDQSKIPPVYQYGFDTRTVQEFPRVVVNTNNRYLLGSNIAGGLEARLNRFARYAGPFDTFTDSKTGLTNNVVREANRFTLIPSVYTTLNPWPWLSLMPSLQYRAFLYNFNDAPDYPNLARGYLLAQAEMSLQLERNIPTDNPNVTFKHTIRPSITYSAIPTIQESRDHLFIKQIQEQARPGQYFDYWDVVPLGTSQNLDTYFTPLGHSITYGITTQVFKKELNAKTHETKISRRFEVKAMQTLDILEAKRNWESGGRDNRIIFSPLFTQLRYADQHFGAGIDYTYYASIDRYVGANLLTYRSPHRFSSSLSWSLEKQLHQGVLKFDRSFVLSYGFSKLTSRTSSLSAELHFSINDYIMPQVKYDFDLMADPNRVKESYYGLLFQSPSRCWSLDAAVTNSIDRGFALNFSFALNLMGGGNFGIEEQLQKQ